ncbi:hypothetical protein LX15_001894 [Streptoalloteichus tenebrarius]|uniref:Uncharacterized protein n=1 Tax=Streptoalloteichus tenebrarius (strain ATCC 17920 / DSM 40477 / JCM 4838 / CBS 697.72 / NBRC 16177 / NCIMB 11028 / NRRL B-12390 / A12253. 1 / ISP 5477) TaxID=1933 RepID=A0ABT1HRY7_STRSD|nr:hypothetical protein [Streptoalloteichus tenebrarius]
MSWGVRGALLILDLGAAWDAPSWACLARSGR